MKKQIVLCYLIVNNVSMGLRTVPFIHADSPVLTVASQLLSTLFLHREIREKGGAYGGGASHSTDGVFSFWSYR
jgi:Zn-dependent M16 (insulinase) family peptidase